MLRILTTLFLLIAGPALADQNALAALSNTLNRTTTLQADFTQFNADGTTSTGTLSMHRPGRLRMDYTNDNDPLVIVGGGRVSIYDGPRASTPEAYPLRRTPLWLLLRPQVNLTTGEGIAGSGTADGFFWVQVFDPNTPEAGRITFFFTPQDLSLRGWTSQSENGDQVRVRLNNIQRDMTLRASLFSHDLETRRRGNDR